MTPIIRAPGKVPKICARPVSVGVSEFPDDRAAFHTNKRFTKDVVNNRIIIVLNLIGFSSGSIAALLFTGEGTHGHAECLKSEQRVLIAFQRFPHFLVPGANFGSWAILYLSLIHI